MREILFFFFSLLWWCCFSECSPLFALSLSSWSLTRKAQMSPYEWWINRSCHGWMGRPQGLSLKALGTVINSMAETERMGGILLGILRGRGLPPLPPPSSHVHHTKSRRPHTLPMWPTSRLTVILTFAQWLRALGIDPISSTCNTSAKRQTQLFLLGSAWYVSHDFFFVHGLRAFVSMLLWTWHTLPVFDSLALMMRPAVFAGCC